MFSNRFAVCFLLACLVGLPLVSLTMTPVAVAQEEAAGGGGGAAAAPPAEEKKQQNAIVWFFHTAGSIGLFIMAVSVYFVALVVQRFMDLRPDVAAPPEIVEQCRTMLEERNFQGVFDLVRGDESFFSKVMAAGIAELPNGLDEAREVMHGQVEAEQVEMDRKISMCAVLGSLGPMIGLVGTLKGMIASFAVIAMSDTQIKASAVAEGISEALLLTLLGVGLSVPAIFFFAIFRNRVAHIAIQTTLLCDEFMRQFSHAARSKPAPAAAAVPVAQPVYRG